MGTAVPAMTTAILAGTAKEMSGIASGVLNAARQAGGAMGVALFGAFAGETPDRAVAGLHVSAAAAVALLFGAAFLALVGVPRRAG